MRFDTILSTPVVLSVPEVLATSLVLAAPLVQQNWKMSEFTLFCREFNNVVIYVFLVLFFEAKLVSVLFKSLLPFLAGAGCKDQLNQSSLPHV